MTATPAPLAAHRGAEPADRAHTTKLDPESGYVPILNTYQVAPEKTEALQGFLVSSTLSTIRYVPGFVTANLHVTDDRTRVVNYAQWTNREAIAAARKNPTVVALMRKQAHIAESFAPVLHELRRSAPAAGA